MSGVGICDSSRRLKGTVSTCHLCHPQPSLQLICYLTQEGRWSSTTIISHLIYQQKFTKYPDSDVLSIIVASSKYHRQRCQDTAAGCWLEMLNVNVCHFIFWCESHSVLSFSMINHSHISYTSLMGRQQCRRWF